MDEKYDPLDHQDSEIRPRRWQLGNVILPLLGVFWVCFFAYILYDAATTSRRPANNSPSTRAQEALPDCNAPCVGCILDLGDLREPVVTAPDPKIPRIDKPLVAVDKLPRKFPSLCSQPRRGYVECRYPETGYVELRISGNVTETFL